MSQKHIVYFNIVTLSQAERGIERLPVIRVINDGKEKMIGAGMEEIGKAILEVVPYLGSDHSEALPLAIEVLNPQEAKLGTLRRRRRRRSEGAA